MRTRPGNSAGEWRSLSSWRAWIEIDPVDAGLLCDGGRSPHGERGLKYATETVSEYGPVVSLSSWRAWIEMRNTRARAVFIEWSLSSWRAWIEML